MSEDRQQSRRHSDAATLRLDGRSLTRDELVDAARATEPLDIEMAATALDRVAQAHRTLHAALAERPVYGVTTGVGANRSVAIAADEQAAQAMRLLRSHVAGVGPVEPDDVVRAAMVVRLNQLLAGHSGIAPRIVDALASALRSGALPTVHRYGAIGTGDLSALAELGLTMAGERPWRAQNGPSVEFGPGDALALMSSNAVTVAAAALAAHDLAQLIDAASAVGALSLLALRGSAEAHADAVQTSRPHPGQATVAASLSRLVGAVTGARVQDPFALRTMPQVHGVAVDAATALGRVLAIELNAGTENPMVSGDGVLHHGNFHAAELAAALDGQRAALVPLAALSAARLGALVNPALTGLPAFLAGEPPGSSGMMTLEYVAADAVAELRARSAPAATGAAVISIGAEEHASFASQAARRAAECVEPLAVGLASELVAAVRALRMAPERIGREPAALLYERAAGVLDPGFEDRAFDDDLAAARRMLDVCAAAVRR